MPPDTSAIQSALLSLLGSDPELLALMPNGVYWGLPPPNSTRFVIVSLIDGVDDRRFEGRSHEDGLYLVKAVGLSKAGQPPPDLRGAAHRIDELLEGATLTAAGYTTMAVQREQPIRTEELDELDPSVRWLHRGGQYRVVMSVDDE